MGDSRASRNLLRTGNPADALKGGKKVVVVKPVKASKKARNKKAY